MHKLSIIVPVYNVADFLYKCIESICEQTYTNIEIILINDGSTDGSISILREFAAKDNRIKLINQINKGANAARNQGIDHATGEWVCFVDGDDWIDRDMCSKLVPYLREDLDILFYSYRYVYPVHVKEMPHSERNFEIDGEEFVELQYAALNRLGPYRFGVHTMDPVSVWDKMYRLDFLKQNELRFHENLPKLQDLLFNLDVYEYAQKGYVVNKAYYNYRVHNESVSRKYQEDIVQKFRMIHSYLNVFMNRHMDDECMKQAYYERIATHIRTCVVLNFCHSRNEKKYKTRKAEFFQTCCEPPFYEAMKKVNLAHFAFKESVLSICIKKKWFWACNLLYKLNHIIVKLKYKNVL